jgi:hypothetical protein
VKAAKSELADLGIPVTISEMAYGFQSHGGAQELMDELDFFDIHMLPYFSQRASTGRIFFRLFVAFHSSRNWS